MGEDVKTKKLMQEYRDKNREKIRKYQHEWRKNNPDKVKECAKKSRLKYKERNKEYAKEYYQKNKEYFRKYYRKYDKSWRKIPKNKLNRNIKTLIWISLNGNKAGKEWEKLVGYSLEDLMKHLESKFEPWMNWENYGKWHIDHIKPVSLFHYNCPEDEEFKKCWALSNLQPLEAIANIKKSNKYQEANNKDERII